MKAGFVKSSPHFFRLIKASGWLFVAAILIVAALIPAPLQEAADPAVTPNPIRSAWFLLWIQELVSYSNRLIYLVMLLGAALILLPWLSRNTFIPKARWFPREQVFVNFFSILFCFAVLVLTIVAMFFRGNNWALTFPF